MPPKTKSTNISEEIPEYLPPWESTADTAGTIEIERIDPDEGLIDAWPAKEYGKMRIKDAFGGREFAIRWLPPDGCGINPQTLRIKIGSDPKRSNGAAKDKPVDQVVEEKMRALLAEQGPSKQWAELLKVQRDEMERQGSSLIDQFGAQSRMFMENQKAAAESQTRFFEETRRRDEAARERDERRAGESAERERLRDEASRGRERDAYQQEIERTRAWTSAQLELARSQSSGPLDSLDGALELYDKVRPLLGDPGKGIGAAIVEGIPGVFEGLGSYVKQQGDAQAKVAHANAAREAAAHGQPIQLPAPEAPAEADQGAIEHAQLITYLQFLSSMADEDWADLIDTHMEAGILPACAIAPIMAAKNGDVAPAVALLREVGANELLPRFAAAFAGAGASGTDPVVEPPPGA